MKSTLPFVTGSTHEFSDFENHYTNSTNSHSALCALMSIKMGFDGVWRKFDYRRAFIYFYKKKNREISTERITTLPITF